MGLEEIIYSNVQIRNFLKLFSQHQWNKVCKSTLLLGIQRLEELMERAGEKGLTSLSVEALDELVVAAHKRSRRHKKRRQPHESPHRESPSRNLRERRHHRSSNKFDSTDN